MGGTQEQFHGVTLTPFRLNCANCQSKIVVRYDHLLGKTLPCPKCQKPIAIPSQSPEAVAPKSSGSQEPSAPREPNNPAPQMDSTALTKADYGDWDEVLANIPQNPLDEHLSQIDWGQDADQRQPEEPMFISVEDESPRLPHQESWQSKDLAKRRQVLLVASIGILSSILAAVGFWGFLSYMRSERVATNVGMESPPPEIPSQEKPSSDPSTRANGENLEIPKSETDTNPSNAEVPAVSDPSIQPSIPTEPTVSIEPLKSSTETSKPPAEEVSEAANKPESTGPLQEKLPDIFGPNGFGFLLDRTVKLPESGYATSPVPTELDIARREEPLAVVFHPMAKPVPIWSETSSLKISRIKFNNEPLPRFMDLVGRLAGIGITLDWQQLRAASIDERTMVSYDGQDKSLAEILDDVLQPLNLIMQLNPAGMPLVVPRAKNAAALESGAWELKGYCKAGNEQSLAEQIIRLYELDETCTAANGQLQWKPGSSTVTMAKVKNTINQLASQLSPPVPKPFDIPSGFSLFDFEALRRSEEALMLKTPMNLVSAEAKGITEHLYAVAQSTKLNLLIDWIHAWEHGLSPSESEYSVLRNRTLPQVAQKYLDEYALELVAIDHDTILLTTETARRQSYVVIPIKKSSDLRVEDLNRGIYILSPKDIDGRSKFKVERLPGEEDVYFARICYPKVSQLEDSQLESTFGW